MKILILYFITGVSKTLVRKWQTQISSDGLPDKNNSTLRHFHHPYFQSIVIAFGQLIFLLYHLKRIFSTPDEDQIRLIESEETEDSVSVSQLRTWKAILHPILLFPALLDTVSTALSGIALIFVNASFLSIVTGSTTLFSAIISKIFLRKKVSNVQWIGLTIVLVSVSIVNVCYFLDNDVTTSHCTNTQLLIAILLIVCSNLTTATQSVFEEWLMRIPHYKFEAYHLIGLESFYSCILFLLALPGLYFIPGPVHPHMNQEDPFDTALQIYNNPIILITVVILIFSSTMCNYAATTVTKIYSSVHRTMLGSARTVFLWMIQIFIRYVIKSQTYGEEITRFSLIIATSFLWMFFGIYLYVTHKPNPNPPQSSTNDDQVADQSDVDDNEQPPVTAVSDLT